MLQYVFAACQPGLEVSLKAELALRHPELHLAFSRPGLVTFKRVDGFITSQYVLDAVFARAFGASIGACEDVPTLLGAILQLRRGRNPLRLHVFEREVFPPGEAPAGVTPGAVSSALEAELRALADLEYPGLFHAETLAQPGDRVIDVIVAANEPPWLGVHDHNPRHSPYPGGLIPLEVPAELPSRSWRKLEEARRGFELPFFLNDTAVEIGASPGGAAYALVNLGVNVVGIDPSPMDPLVLKKVGPGGARANWMYASANMVRREGLPRKVDWLLIDANLSPQLALHTVHRFADRMRTTLVGVIFTLKLNDQHQLVHIPRLLRRVAAMGVLDPCAIQRPSDRQEFCVVGLTRLGLGRLERVGVREPPRPGLHLTDLKEAAPPVTAEDWDKEEQAWLEGEKRRAGQQPREELPPPALENKAQAKAARRAAREKSAQARRHAPLPTPGGSQRTSGGSKSPSPGPNRSEERPARSSARDDRPRGPRREGPGEERPVRSSPRDDRPRGPRREGPGEERPTRSNPRDDRPRGPRPAAPAEDRPRRPGPRLEVREDASPREREPGPPRRGKGQPARETSGPRATPQRPQGASLKGASRFSPGRMTGGKGRGGKGGR